MTRTLSTLAIATALAGATIAAYAAMPPRHAFAPPTADQMGLAGPAAKEWNALRDATIDQREAARADLEQRIATLRTLLASDAPDLDAFDRDAEEAIDTRLAAARELRRRKLAFYDALVPSDQAKVRAVMLDRLDRLTRTRAALQDLAAAP